MIILICFEISFLYTPMIILGGKWRYLVYFQNKYFLSMDFKFEIKRKQKREMQEAKTKGTSQSFI